MTYTLGFQSIYAEWRSNDALLVNLIKDFFKRELSNQVIKTVTIQRKNKQWVF